MKRFFPITCIITCLAFTGKAQQGEVKASINYSAAMPVGSFKNWVSNTSWRGWNATILYGLNDKFSIGGSVGFQDFYEKYPRQIYTTAEGSDISAVLSNSIQTIPIALSGRYHFLPGMMIQPYAGLSIGGNIIMYEQLLGEYSGDSKNKFGFTARPDIGVFVPVSKNKLTGIDLAASYNFMPFKYGEIEKLDNVNIRLGIAFPLRN